MVMSSQSQCSICGSEFMEGDYHPIASRCPLCNPDQDNNEIRHIKKINLFSVSWVSYISFYKSCKHMWE